MGIKEFQNEFKSSFSLLPFFNSASNDATDPDPPNMNAYNTGLLAEREAGAETQKRFAISVPLAIAAASSLPHFRTWINRL